MTPGGQEKHVKWPPGWPQIDPWSTPTRPLIDPKSTPDQPLLNPCLTPNQYFHHGVPSSMIIDDHRFSSLTFIEYEWYLVNLMRFAKINDTTRKSMISYGNQWYPTEINDIRRKSMIILHEDRWFSMIIDNRTPWWKYWFGVDQGSSWGWFRVDQGSSWGWSGVDSGSWRWDRWVGFRGSLGRFVGFLVVC